MPISAKNIQKLGLECKDCRYYWEESSWCYWHRKNVDDVGGLDVCAHWDKDLPEDKKVDKAPDSAILPEKEEQ